METDNRILLERAIAAEEAAQQLKAENESLQHRLEYCEHKHRPKTAPEKRRAMSSNAISNVHNNSTQNSQDLHLSLQTPGNPPALTPPSNRRRRPVPKPLTLNKRRPPSASARYIDDPFLNDHGTRSAISQTPTSHRPEPQALSQPLTYSTPTHDLAPFPFAATPLPSRRSQPPPSHPRTLHTHRSLSSIGSPIPGSVSKHTVTYAGVPLSSQTPVPIISLAEARKRNGSEDSTSSGSGWKLCEKNKALPPPGPMSPSTIPGRVEIGCEKRGDYKEESEKNRMRSFSELFRWGRKGYDF
jgi:hypothetical protein